MAPRLSSSCTLKLLICAGSSAHRVQHLQHRCLERHSSSSTKNHALYKHGKTFQPACITKCCCCSPSSVGRKRKRCNRHSTAIKQEKKLQKTTNSLTHFVVTDVHVSRVARRLRRKSRQFPSSRADIGLCKVAHKPDRCVLPDSPLLLSTSTRSLPCD